jgi:hypothetical protein
MSRSWFLVLLAGCGGATITTTTTLSIRDASRVMLLRDDRSVFAAAGSASVSLGSQTIEPAPGGRSEVGLAVNRADSGEISVRWDTRLPIMNGEEQVLVPKAGLTDLPAPPLAPDAGPTLRLDACTYLKEAGVTRRVGRMTTYSKTGFDAMAVPEACSPDWLGASPFALETPWDNVEIHRRVRVSPNARRAAFGAAGAFLAIPISLLPYVGAAYGSHSDGLGNGILIASAVGLVLGGVFGIAGAMLPGPTVTMETLAPDGTVLGRSPVQPER